MLSVSLYRFRKVACVAVFSAATLICLSVLYSCSALSKDGKERNRTTVTWMIGVDYTKDMLEDLIQRFEEIHPDIHIKPIWVPALQYYPKLKTLIAAGQPPDLFTCGDVWIAYQLPFLYDITDLVQRDKAEIDLEDIYPELLDACQWNRRYYFLPRWFNISLLYYNKSLFDGRRYCLSHCRLDLERLYRSGQSSNPKGPRRAGRGLGKSHHSPLVGGMVDFGAPVGRTVI